MLHPNELKNLHDRAKEVEGAGLVADQGTLSANHDYSYSA